MMAPVNTINKLAQRHRNNLHFSCITDMGSGMKNHGQTVGNKIDYHAIILPNLCTEAMTNIYSPFFLLSNLISNTCFPWKCWICIVCICIACIKYRKGRAQMHCPVSAPLCLYVRAAPAWSTRFLRLRMYEPGSRNLLVVVCMAHLSKHHYCSKGRHRLLLNMFHLRVAIFSGMERSYALRACSKSFQAHVAKSDFTFQRNQNVNTETGEKWKPDFTETKTFLLFEETLLTSRFQLKVSLGVTWILIANC